MSFKLSPEKQAELDALVAQLEEHRKTAKRLQAKRISSALSYVVRIPLAIVIVLLASLLSLITAIGRLVLLPFEFLASKLHSLGRFLL